MGIINIVLADDQSLFAESLQTFLDNYADDMNVAGIAKNGREAIEMADSLKPDIILMDIRMPEIDGVEAVRQIKPRHPDIKIIMLSTYKEDALVRSALLAGASGYLLKDISPSELITAIRALQSGIMQMSPEVARNLIQNQNNVKRERLLVRSASAPDNEGIQETMPFQSIEQLTNREQDIFNLIAKGYDNDQITAELNLAEQTVRNHVSTIYAKLGVKDRFEIIRLANKANTGV